MEYISPRKRFQFYFAFNLLLFCFIFNHIFFLFIVSRKQKHRSSIDFECIVRSLIRFKEMDETSKKKHSSLFGLLLNTKNNGQQRCDYCASKIVLDAPKSDDEHECEWKGENMGSNNRMKSIYISVIGSIDQ